MRAAFLCPNVPFPPENGGHHRNLGLIRALARFASVDVFAIGEPRDPRSAIAREHLATLGARLDVYPPSGPGPAEDDPDETERTPDAAAHFRSPALADELSSRAAAAPYDVAHVEELVMAQYAGALGCARVIDRQKVEFAYHAAMARVASGGAARELREGARFLWWERRLAGSFDRVLVPGESDRLLLEPLHGPGCVSIVPIAIADELRPPAPATRRVDHVLLYGARDYGPNVEAERFFFAQVWPRLKASAPGLKVKVVGSGRPPLGAQPPPADAGVEVLGFVEEISPLLQGPAAAAVCVQVGGGARTKVLEALACGMPVVSTAIGVENLGLVPGRDFLLAETAAETADALLQLHRDPARAAALAREGPRRVEAFRWSRVETVYREILNEVAARGRRSGARAAAAQRPLDDSPQLARLARELAPAPGAPRPTAALRRAVRRLRRSPPVASAERAALRLLDAIHPATGGGAGSRARRGLLRALGAVRRGLSRGP